MREFDLAAAKAGAPVCTRSGLEARIIGYDRRGYPASVIIALLDGGHGEGIEFYYADGRWEKDKDRKEDLMMRDDDYAEKLARGEYGPTVKEKLTVDTPTCKESLPVDREYWRRVYAGEAMAARLALSGSWCMNETVKGAVEMADALLAELEK